MSGRSGQRGTAQGEVELMVCCLSSCSRPRRKGSAMPLGSLQHRPEYDLENLAGSWVEVICPRRKIRRFQGAIELADTARRHSVV